LSATNASELDASGRLEVPPDAPLGKTPLLVPPPTVWVLDEVLVLVAQLPEVPLTLDDPMIAVDSSRAAATAICQ